jgi:toxin-antitoxin system PIN domain toxin
VSQTVDTNVLVYASNEDSPRHERSRALIDVLSAGPRLTVLLWPTILGYLRIVTHPGIFPNPLSHEDAVGNISGLLERPSIRCGSEEDGFWDVYRKVAAPLKPRGNLVPDAHLVALMQQQGVATIWTADRDFRKFDGITALDPFSDRYRDGFV